MLLCVCQLLHLCCLRIKFSFCSYSKNSGRASVLLGANKTGDLKLPPDIIFKGAKNRKARVYRELKGRDDYPKDCEYYVQASAWMDEDIFIDFLNDIWLPYLDANGIKLALLLLDMCSVHLTPNVKLALSAARTEVEFIPAGYTAKLQPMDVGINKPFKNYIKREYDAWWYTNRNVNKKITRQSVANWVSQAWATITPNIIRNSWRHAGYLFETEFSNRLLVEPEQNNWNDHLVLDNFDVLDASTIVPNLP